MDFDNSFDIIIPDTALGITLGGTNGAIMPVGTTAQRPVATPGMIRYNSTLGKLENSTATSWVTHSVAPTISTTAPTTPIYGDWWVNSTTGAVAVYSTVGTVDQFVPTSSSNASTFTSGTLALAQGGTGVTTGLASRALVAGSLTQPFQTSQLTILSGGIGGSMIVSQGNDTTKANNVVIGINSLVPTTTGDNNTLVGSNTGPTVTGAANTIIGSFAGNAITAGGYNVAVGANALRTSIGSNSVAVGYAALQNAAGGTDNTVIGALSLANLTSGTRNTVVGSTVGNTITTGTSNLILGDMLGGFAAGMSNNIVFGTAGVIRAQYNGTSWLFNDLITATSGFSSPSGEINLKGATTLADANSTITASQMKLGLFTIGATLSRIITTDTAANIIANMVGYQIGSHYAFAILNTGIQSITMIGGTGVTLIGKTVISTSTGEFRVVVTSATTVSLYNTGSDGPGGGANQMQFNANGIEIGAANAEIDNGDIVLVYNETPVIPQTDRLKLFNRKSATRSLLHIVGPVGTPSALQPHVGRNKAAVFQSPGNVATLPVLTNYGTPATIGTLTARISTTTSVATRARRLGFVTAATAGLLAGMYQTTAQITTGITIGTVLTGGFYIVVRFAISDTATVAGARMFLGVSSTVAAPTNVEPSTLLNSVGVGHGAADTNLKIYFGGSVAQTPIDLGANFPLTIGTAVLYELSLFCSGGNNGSAQVGYQVINITSGATASGTLVAATPGTQLPLNTTLLTYGRYFRTNNATALTVGLDIISDYVETDN